VRGRLGWIKKPAAPPSPNTAQSEGEESEFVRARRRNWARIFPFLPRGDEGPRRDLLPRPGLRHRAHPPRARRVAAPLAQKPTRPRASLLRPCPPDTTSLDRPSAPRRGLYRGPRSGRLLSPSRHSSTRRPSNKSRAKHRPGHGPSLAIQTQDRWTTTAVVLVDRGKIDDGRSSSTHRVFKRYHGKQPPSARGRHRQAGTSSR
jgi:hypothetical protein